MRDLSEMRQRHPSWDIMLLLILFGASLCGNVLLGLSLRNAGAVQAAASNSEQIEAATDGHVPFLQVKTLKGQQEKLSLMGHQTVIYVFGVHCRWCARNIKSERSLITQEQAEVIGVVRSADGVSAYLTENHLHLPVYVLTDIVDAKQLDIVGTPQTIVVNKQGTVVHNWVGIYDGHVRDAIDDYLGIKLPRA